MDRFNIVVISLVVMFMDGLRRWTIVTRQEFSNSLFLF